MQTIKHQRATKKGKQKSTIQEMTDSNLSKDKEWGSSPSQDQSGILLTAHFRCIKIKLDSDACPREHKQKKWIKM